MNAFLQWVGLSRLVFFFENRFINPFIFVGKKYRVMSSEGFSFLEKNTMICSQRAMLAIQSGTTVRCRLKWPFGALVFEFELAGSPRMWDPAADCNGCLARY
jgi:hypothetical protein